MGINVNSTLSDFPAEAEGQRTTLRDQFGAKLSREEVLLEVAQAITHEIERLRSGEWQQILEEYRKLSYLTGRTVTLDEGTDESFTGVVKGIGDEGSLEVTTPDGETRSFFSANVTVHPDSREP